MMVAPWSKYNDKGLWIKIQTVTVKFTLRLDKELSHMSLKMRIFWALPRSGYSMTLVLFHGICKVDHKSAKSIKTHLVGCITVP